jgi:hypothetical protein
MAILRRCIRFPKGIVRDTLKGIHRVINNGISPVIPRQGILPRAIPDMSKIQGRKHREETAKTKHKGLEF